MKRRILIYAFGYEGCEKIVTVLPRESVISGVLSIINKYKRDGDFIRIITDIEAPREFEVFSSKEEKGSYDTLLVYFSGHGKNNSLIFPNGDHVYIDDFIISTIGNPSSFDKTFFMLDACEMISPSLPYCFGRNKYWEETGKECLKLSGDMLILLSSRTFIKDELTILTDTVCGSQSEDPADIIDLIAGIKNIEGIYFYSSIKDNKWMT